MNFKTNLCMFSILGILAILSIFVHFGSDFLFPSLKTNPPNNAPGLSVSVKEQPRTLQPNRKGNTKKPDRHIQEISSVSSAALSLSDGKSPFCEYESSDTHIDPTLDELSLEDEKYFFGEEDHHLQEEILAAEEELNQYADPEQEYEMAEEELEASLVAASLAPVEDEPFYKDTILQEEDALIDESVEAWQEED